jgi:hypothetical protein
MDLVTSQPMGFIAPMVAPYISGLVFLRLSNICNLVKSSLWNFMIQYIEKSGKALLLL